MKIGKTSYSKKAQSELQGRYGYTKEQAKAVWNRTYRQVLKASRRLGVTKDFNVSRELYSSMFYRGNQLFEIDRTGVLPKAKISSQFENVTDLEERFTEVKFENMAKKYDEVQVLLDKYKKHEISYKDFRQSIETFRKTNTDYLRSGS